MAETAALDQVTIRAALDLAADASVQVVVERIEALRLVREAVTLDQVRRVLGLTPDASPLACAGELCRRLPRGWHHEAVLAMQIVEASEQCRALRVDEIRRDALARAHDGSAQ